ncbi:SH3 domain-containing protein [Actinacidiphila glaucinigra]|uniref:SH3 domain-containing protein n=1 Tax=Actinacidiphila glaucinigra TaxID=235986 RepID=UPI00367C0B69
MKLRHQLATLSAAAALIVGGSVALAPTASAVGSSACQFNTSDLTMKISGNGVNFRTGPGTKYSSRGLLYKSDGYVFRYTCRTYPERNGGDFDDSWSYGYLVKRSVTGIPKGTYGWVSSAYTDWAPH